MHTGEAIGLVVRIYMYVSTFVMFLLVLRDYVSFEVNFELVREALSLMTTREVC